MKKIFKFLFWFIILAFIFQLLSSIAKSGAFPYIIGALLIFGAYKTLLPIYMKKKKEKFESQIFPYIQQYVSAYTNIWKVWPISITLSEYDYKSIRNLIEKEYHIDSSILAKTNFNQLVDSAIDQSGYELFKSSFLSAISPLPMIITKDFLEEEYYKLFEQNLFYIPFFLQLLSEYNITSSKSNLQNDLSLLNEKRAIIQRSEAIKDAITTNGSLLKNIDINYIDSLSGIEFENILKLLFSQMGYSVKLTKASGDQGADLLLSKAGIEKIVQAKCYHDKVSNTAVQEAVAAKAYYKYPQATVVTNNYFTQGAKDLAKANNVELIDREQLIDLLNSHPLST